MNESMRFIAIYVNPATVMGCLWLAGLIFMLWLDGGMSGR